MTLVPKNTNIEQQQTTTLFRRCKMKVKFYTIKQYTGEMDASAEMLEDLRQDKSIVWFEAYHSDGSLFERHDNEFAVPVIKHCPCEKSHIGLVKEHKDD